MKNPLPIAYIIAILAHPNTAFTRTINQYCEKIYSYMVLASQSLERLKQTTLIEWSNNIYQFISHLNTALEHDHIEAQIRWIQDHQKQKPRKMPSEWHGNVSLHYLCLCLTNTPLGLRDAQIASLKNHSNWQKICRASADVFFIPPTSPKTIFKDAFTDT